MPPREAPIEAGVFEQLEEHLLAAAFELFASQGMKASAATRLHAPPELAGDAVTAVIGFAARQGRGSVVLLASRPTVRAMVPEPMREEVGDWSEALCDLLGESANMLLGRLKNRLLSRGLVMSLATPSAVCGNELRVMPASGESWAWHEVHTDTGAVFVRLDATFEGGFALSSTPGPASGSVPEGETLLFV